MRSRSCCIFSRISLSRLSASPGPGDDGLPTGLSAVVFSESLKPGGSEPLCGRIASRIPKYMAAVTAPPAHRTMATAVSGPICTPRFTGVACFSPDFRVLDFAESLSVRTGTAGVGAFFFSLGGRGRAWRVSRDSPQRGQWSGTGLARSRIRNSVRQSGQSSRWIVMSVCSGRTISHPATCSQRAVLCKS